MAIYYFSDHEQRYRILNGDGLSAYSSIYADGQIDAPVYDRLTNKFIVSYNIHTKNDKVVEKTKSFEDRGSAIDFYLKQYRTYQYEWSMMFYEDFKTCYRRNDGKTFNIKNVDNLLSRLQNLQNSRRRR